MRPETLEERVAHRLRTGSSRGASRSHPRTSALAAIRETHRIEPKGTPIAPGDIRKGDRIRTEWPSGNVRVFTSSGPYPSTVSWSADLLYRPDPDELFEFPTKDGAVIRLEMQGLPSTRTVASRLQGLWYIAGISGSRNETSLREKCGNFEVLSDGIDQ